MTAEVQYSTETWTCMGRRISTKGKLVYLWTDIEGEQHAFDKLKGQPGRRYEVQVDRSDGTSVLIDNKYGPLHDLYRKQVGPARRAAFLAVVIEMVTR